MGEKKMDHAHESRRRGGDPWRLSLIASVFLRELGSKVSCRVRVKKEVLDLRRNEKVKIRTWEMYGCWAASRTDTEGSGAVFKERG